MTPERMVMPHLVYGYLPQPLREWMRSHPVAYPDVLPLAGMRDLPFL